MNTEIIQKVLELQNVCHKAAVDAGWWDDPDRCIYQTLQLANTEVSEATEGDRKGLMDDKLSHYPMEWVELADTLIRLLDFAASEGNTYKGGGPEAMLDAMTNSAAKHFVITCCICTLGTSIHVNNMDRAQRAFDAAISTILEIADEHDFDIFQIAYEKIEFNKHREDHKRENRAKEGGKKY